MTRLTPGPFGGAFDEIGYDSPLFIPVIVLIALLMFVWVAVVWALLRRRVKRPPRSTHGFEVKPITDAKSVPESEKERPD